MGVIKAINVLLKPTITYSGSYHVLRILLPLVLLRNGTLLHLACGALLAVLVALSMILCYRRLLARAMADGPPQPLHCCPVLCSASRWPP